MKIKQRKTDKRLELGFIIQKCRSLKAFFGTRDVYRDDLKDVYQTEIREIYKRVPNEDDLKDVCGDSR